MAAGRPRSSRKICAETEADIYGGMERTSNVRAAMSLHPDSVRWLSDLFDAHYLSWIEIHL